MKVAISKHAIERYVARVKPWLEPDAARAEIEALASLSEPTPFCDYVEEGEHFDAFVELAPGITLGCRHEDSKTLLAVTCMIRTGESEADRQRRRIEKKKRKNRARAQKRREQIARRRGEAQATYGVGWPE